MPVWVSPACAMCVSLCVQTLARTLRLIEALGEVITVPIIRPHAHTHAEARFLVCTLLPPSVCVRMRSSCVALLSMVSAVQRTQLTASRLIKCVCNGARVGGLAGYDELLRAHACREMCWVQSGTASLPQEEQGGDLSDLEDTD